MKDFQVGSTGTKLEKKKAQDLAKLRPQILDTGEKKESKLNYNTMRIQCEAIDFDWMFEGDNMANMIKMLTKQNNPSLYVSKSINVFIDLIWEKYSSSIKRWVFIPYMVYLLAFINLASSVDDGYLY